MRFDAVTLCFICFWRRDVVLIAQIRKYICHNETSTLQLLQPARQRGWFFALDANQMVVQFTPRPSIHRAELAVVAPGGLPDGITACSVGFWGSCVLFLTGGYRCANIAR